MYQIEKVVTYLRSGLKPYFLFFAVVFFFELGTHHYLTNALNLRLAIEWLISNPSYFTAIWWYLFDLVVRISLTFVTATLCFMFTWIFVTHRKDLEFTRSSVVMLLTSFAMAGFAVACAGLIALPVWLLLMPATTLCLLETWRMRAMADT